MGISPDAPIVRFGRWLETLSLKDFFVIGVLSPVLGLVSVVGPAWLAAPSKPRADEFLSDSIEQLDFRSVILLFMAGMLVALLSRKLGVWAASTVMLVYFLAIVFDFAAGSPGHNLLPFELAIYSVLAAFAIAGAGVIALVRR